MKTFSRWALFLLLLGGGLWGARYQLQSWLGAPAENLSFWQQWRYGLLLWPQRQALARPCDASAPAQDFVIELGESAAQVAQRLEAAGLVCDGASFQRYLIYRGLDVRLQAGRYRLTPAMTPLEIAAALQDPLPGEAHLVILAGWRLEEIAAALPVSGLQVSPDDFLQAARQLPAGYDFLLGATSVEGFLLPGSYALPRDMEAAALVDALVSAFGLALTPSLREGFARQGLTIHQAVTLASIVQRESMAEDEMPVIASVFYNRLRADMRLESDPTVQYALGYDAARGGWWPSPLTLDDLQLDSPYNTYRYPGLPPGPIAAPSLAALQAVAFPAQTPYFYFRAACDGSGRHLFARTYEGHLQNACP